MTTDATPDTPAPDPSAGAADQQQAEAANELWHAFLDRVEAARPELFRYARALTRTIWDAEDLTQETMVRAFGIWPRSRIQDPKRYLFRTMTNLWRSMQRAAGKAAPAMEEDAALSAGEEEATMADASQRVEVGDALIRLATALPPRDRLAVLLVDGFGFATADAAETLEIRSGAVKSALHRGRERLAALQDAPLPSGADDPVLTMFPGRAPSAAELSDWLDAFHARDVDRLLTMMASDARTQILGEVDSTDARTTKMVLHHTVVDPRLVRAEPVEIDGETVLVLLYDPTRKDRNATPTEPLRVGDVLRVRLAPDADGVERIVETRWYYFSVDFLRAVADRLGREPFTNGYYYTPAIHEI